jgi:hypothetical protein
MKSDVVREFFHPAKIDDALERAGSEFVAHQGDIAAARSSNGSEATWIEWDTEVLELAAHPPQSAQGIECLKVTKIVGFWALNGVLGAALEVIDAQGDHIELVGEDLGIGGSDTIGAAPIV